MGKREDCLAWLDAQRIVYEVLEHPPAFTMEDIQAFGVDQKARVCKNLFLRDSARGKRHFLVVVQGDKKADLKKLGEDMGQRLSFASEGRLQKYLGLAQGEVSPLGVMYDKNHEVEVLLDAELEGCVDLGFHPCDNACTVVFPYESLRKILENNGNTVRIVTI